VKISSAVRPVCRIDRKRGKDRTGQDGTVKKVFRLFEEPSTVPIDTKICMAGYLADIITLKFQDDVLGNMIMILQGGGANFPFSIDFCMGLTTMQR